MKNENGASATAAMASTPDDARKSELVEALLATYRAAGTEGDALERVRADLAEYDVPQLEIWVEQGREQALRKEREQRLLSLLAPHAAALDPNWYRVHVLCEEDGALSAWVNGPAQGDIALPVPIQELLPTDLHEWLPREGDRDDHRSIQNPHHAFVFRANEVLLGFENVECGYVTAVEGETVRFWRLTSGFEDACSASVIAEALTTEELWDMGGQVVDLHYCPCRMTCSVYECVVLRNGAELALADNLWDQSLPRNAASAPFGPSLKAALAKHRGES